MASFDYDVVIVGSGFGGSVAALRATVALVELAERSERHNAAVLDSEPPLPMLACRGECRLDHEENAETGRVKRSDCWKERCVARALSEVWLTAEVAVR